MIRFWRNIGYALTGCQTAFRSERSLKIQIVAMVLTIAAGIYVKLSPIEWGLVTFAIGAVITAELFNTALERLCDEISKGQPRLLIKKAKDISAAAVLVSSLTALTIGIWFILIPLVQKIAVLL